MAVRAGIVVRHSVDEPRLGIPGTWAATEMGDSSFFGHRTQHLAVRRATGTLTERHNTSKRCFDVCKYRKMIECIR